LPPIPPPIISSQPALQISKIFSETSIKKFALQTDNFNDNRKK